MSNFTITLIRPAGYQHTEAFREIAETLQFGLRSLGHTAEIRENAVDPGATNIILGAHLLPASALRQLPEEAIIYNLEQLGGARLSPEYYELGRRHRIWDYDLANLAQWNELHCKYSPVHVPIGYVPELKRIAARQPQDIDVLFYGSLNERRNRILDQLGNSGVKVHKLFGVYGEQRDALIARSKLVLNIHFYQTKIFEIARMSYLLANAKAVVTEGLPSTATEHGLDGGLLVVPYDSLVEACLLLLRHEEERRALETRGFELFSQRKESDILSNALQQTPVVSANSVVLPRKLNLGSGKDWRQDYFNIDVDSYWQPDAVLDFNLPLPIGEPLSTSRFGTVSLEHNYFDEIISNDVLEHIRNLTTAMTTCLNLLRVGGLFKIAVPYDLSWGAWQDPTHVRAFNERSWLYYTDWFWYMGWTEARFDIAGFDLTLSPIGEALRQQNMKGEDLARHPRAIDHMRVALRKRLLTDAEKQQVHGYLQRPNRTPDQLAGPAQVHTQCATATSGLTSV